VQNIEAAIRSHVDVNNAQMGMGGKNYLHIDVDMLQE
jgi:hypothetical protein